MRWLVELPGRLWRWLMDDTPPAVPDTYRVGAEKDQPAWSPGDDYRVDGGGGVPPL